MMDGAFPEADIERASFAWEPHDGEAIEKSKVAEPGAFPDFTVTVKNVLPHGAAVGMQRARRGTHKGESMGPDASSNSFENQGTAIIGSDPGISPSGGVNQQRSRYSGRLWTCRESRTGRRTRRRLTLQPFRSD